MTLSAYSLASPLSSPLGALRRDEAGAAPAGSRGGFAALDDRVAAPEKGGILFVHAPSPDAGVAAGAHVGRRAAASGGFVLSLRARVGAPLWREVASQLGLARVSSQPRVCAEEIAQAAVPKRAVIIAPLPPAGSWDRLVAQEVAHLALPPLVVFLTDGAEAASDLRADAFDIGATLDHSEMGRWWAAVADQAHAELVTDDLAALEAWWGAMRRVEVPCVQQANALPDEGRVLFTGLALAARSWPAGELAALLSRASPATALAALEQAGAIKVARGWIHIDRSWEEEAGVAEVAASDVSLLDGIGQALIARFPADPWAQTRAAELFIRAEKHDEADAAHAAAVSATDDPIARREMAQRWMSAVSGVPFERQLALRVRAAERALGVGEAEEAFAWAQTAVALAPNDARVALLVGRAAIALGDLVAARVALERARSYQPDADTAALIAVELAEVAYLNGDLADAQREAELANTTSSQPAARLKARNVLGKILLAHAKWDEADHHFAEDAWAASAAGLATAELRARLNRGIALLSKGLADEAHAIFDAVHAEGERLGQLRACAYALDNLAVVAILRHDYAGALSASERALKLWQRLGDRLSTALMLSNLAELRRKLGLLDHAEHAVAFGRRVLGAGHAARALGAVLPPRRAERVGPRQHRRGLA